MDDLERRKTFDALKEKAVQAKVERQRQAMAERKVMHMRFDRSRTSAANEHVLKVLESSRVKHLTHIDNRPAEKLVKGRTKGTKKRAPSGSPSI